MRAQPPVTYMLYCRDQTIAPTPEKPAAQYGPWRFIDFADNLMGVYELTYSLPPGAQWKALHFRAFTKGGIIPMPLVPPET